MSSDLPDLLELPNQPRALWLRALCVLGALLCFVLGVFGWLVPLVTGIPFYVMGLLLLGMASERTRRWVNRMEQKLPHRWRLGIRRLRARVGGGRRRGA